MIIDINKEINRYIESKPKYFSRDEINKLITFLNTLNEHINSLEFKQKSCMCNYLLDENKLLKMKLSTIKYNLENVEFEHKLPGHNYEKKKGMKDIIILLEHIKTHQNIAISFVIYVLLIILKFLYYVFILYKKRIN